MDLSCNENINKQNAQKDNLLFSDQRVFNSLLEEESFYVPKCDYFQKVQTDIQPFMRKVVTTWMLEVCEEQMCEDQVLPLAINFMDRFLCVQAIKKQQLQLLGATCLLLASKLRSTSFLPIDLLCAYTDYSVTYEQISSWELLVLMKLQWNLSAITGFDYIDHILERCSWGNDNGLLRRHAHTLVSICYTEPSLIQTPPSVIAAACLISAIRGLKLSIAYVAEIDISNMVKADMSSIELLVTFIDGVIEKVVPPSPEPQSKLAGYESPQYGQPETPTEVESIYF